MFPYKEVMFGRHVYNTIYVFLQYLMTKTAAMHFGGPAAAASGGHHGGMGGSRSSGGMGEMSSGGGSGGSNSGRDVKPHQCQQCLKTFSSNHQLVQHMYVSFCN